MFYVIDTDAALMLPGLMTAQNLNLFLVHLVGCCDKGEVYIPEPVIRECRRLASGEVIGVWMAAMAGRPRRKSVPSEHVVRIISRCPEFMNDDAAEADPSQLHVAAMADFLQDGSMLPVCVVTEDREDGPTGRMCLLKACNILGFRTMDAVTFVQTIGPDYLGP